jgi:hypothetical protein
MTSSSPSEKPVDIQEYLNRWAAQWLWGLRSLWRPAERQLIPMQLTGSITIADRSLRLHAKVRHLLARLELVLSQIAELERERDAVVETEASSSLLPRVASAFRARPCWCARRSCVASPMAGHSDHTLVWLLRHIVAVAREACRNESSTLDHGAPTFAHDGDTIM